MKNILVLVAMLFASSLMAQDQFELVEKVEPQAGKVLIPYTKYKLKSNDLTLIIHEDHSDPVVHVQVAYHVGSARENVRNSGFAHFFEHMMFQGSKNVEDEEHFKIINGAGGTNNAYTSFDKTVYTNTAPSNMTETMLWLEADRMGTHLDGFTQKKFENQRNAVKNEKRQRYDNVPYGMVNEIMFKTLYRDHPYEWTPIGFVDDLDIASFEDLRNFFLRWYGPNNAIVVVSGDVNPEDVKKWVAKYYGGIKKCPEVRDMYPKKPVLNNDYFVTTKDYIQAPLTVMAFPTVPEFHKDEAALNVLAQIIGSGQSSILYKNLVKTENALSANAGHGSLELSGFFEIDVLTAPVKFGGYTSTETVDAIRKALKDFETQGVSDEDFEVIKSGVLRQAYGALDNVASKAEVLHHFTMMKGEGYNLQDEIDRYASLTKQDVIDAYNKYIKGNYAVIIRVEPDEEQRSDDDDTPRSVNPHADEPKKVDRQYVGLEYEPPVDDFDRSKRPEVPVSKTVEIPEYYTSQYENGMQVIGTESTETPLVYAYMTIEGGHMLEANRKIRTGTAYMTAVMMGMGTKSLTSEEFSRKLDVLGSSISFNAGTTSTTVFISSLKENLDETLALLEDALFNPRFDKEDFRRLRDQITKDLTYSRFGAGTMAIKAWNSIFYEGTILEELTTGDPNNFKKLKLKDVEEYYNKYYVGNKTNLVIAGDLNKDEAISKFKFLSNMKKGDFEVPALPELKTPTKKTTIYLVDKPYASQSTIWAGHLSRPFDYNGDYFKSSVMNYALGGAFNSRINLNLREEHGFTYGARSFFGGNKYYGYYRFSSEIRKDATDSSIVELMKEINGYVNEGITEEELEFTKNSLILSQALDYESPIQKLIFLNQLLEYSLPADYVDQQSAIIQSLTVEDVNAIAKQSLHPDNMVIIVVGHAYKIRESLKALGYEVEEIDVN